MPFTKQHSAYAWVVTCILFWINLTFHNLPLHSAYKIHQPFTDYFFTTTILRAAWKTCFSLSGQPSSSLLNRRSHQLSQANGLRFTLFVEFCSEVPEEPWSKKLVIGDNVRLKTKIWRTSISKALPRLRSICTTRIWGDKLTLERPEYASMLSETLSPKLFLR